MESPVPGQSRHKKIHGRTVPGLSGVPLDSQRQSTSWQKPGQQTRNVSDIKQMAVEELRAAIAGNQWLFSCFSPLKDDFTIPGLVDIAPEELRFEAYRAQEQNDLETYKSRIELLKQNYVTTRSQVMNMDLNSFQQMVVNRAVPAPSGNAFSQTSPMKVFSGGSALNTSSFQGGNVFGNSSSTPQQGGTFSLSNTNLFGGSSTSTFGQTTFGQTANVFGGTSSTVSNIFGQAAGTSSTPSMGQSFAPSKTLFGSEQSSNTANIFGQSQANTLFGQSPSTNTFGQSQTSSPGNVFGQPLAHSSPQSNLFGQPQPASFGSAPTQGGSVFGTPTFGQSQQQATSSIFGQSPAAPSTSSFSQPQTATTTSGNLFSQAASPLVQQSSFSQPTNVFGQATTTQAGLFGQPSAQPNVFSQAVTQQVNPFTAAATSNVFSQPTATTSSSNIFAPQPTTSQGNVFSQYSFTSAATRGGSGELNPFAQGSNIDCQHYSTLEDLSEGDKGAFNASEFVLGKIPFRPPPKESCV